MLKIRLEFVGVFVNRVLEIITRFLSVTPEHLTSSGQLGQCDAPHIYNWIMQMKYQEQTVGEKVSLAKCNCYVPLIMVSLLDLQGCLSLITDT